MPKSSNLSQATKTMKCPQNVQAQESWEAREISSHLTDLNAKFEIFIITRLWSQNLVLKSKKSLHTCCNKKLSNLNDFQYNRMATQSSILWVLVFPILQSISSRGEIYSNLVTIIQCQKQRISYFEMKPRNQLLARFTTSNRLLG